MEKDRMIEKSRKDFYKALFSTIVILPVFSFLLFKNVLPFSAGDEEKIHTIIMTSAVLILINAYYLNCYRIAKLKKSK